MDQKTAKAVREGFYSQVEGITFEGFTFEGMTKDGALFSDTEGNFATAKLIVRKETYDSTDALEEYVEAQEKAAERAAKKATKDSKDKTKADDAADEIVEEILEL